MQSHWSEKINVLFNTRNSQRVSFSNHSGCLHQPHNYMTHCVLQKKRKSSHTSWWSVASESTWRVSDLSAARGSREIKGGVYRRGNISKWAGTPGSCHQLLLNQASPLRNLSSSTHTNTLLNPHDKQTKHTYSLWVVTVNSALCQGQICLFKFYPAAINRAAEMDSTGRSISHTQRAQSRTPPQQVPWKSHIHGDHSSPRAADSHS